MHLEKTTVLSKKNRVKYISNIIVPASFLFEINVVSISLFLSSSLISPRIFKVLTSGVISVEGDYN